MHTCMMDSVKEQFFNQNRGLALSMTQSRGWKPCFLFHRFSKIILLLSFFHQEERRQEFNSFLLYFFSFTMLSDISKSTLVLRECLGSRQKGLQRKFFTEKFSHLVTQQLRLCTAFAATTLLSKLLISFCREINQQAKYRVTVRALTELTSTREMAWQMKQWKYKNTAPKLPKQEVRILPMTAAGTPSLIPARFNSILLFASQTYSTIALINCK